MEFLKEIFGSEALTYEQLAEKIKDNGNIKIANLASGEYVSKYRFEEAEKLLAAERTKLEGYDPEWKTKVANAEKLADEKLNSFKLEQAVDNALKNAKARDSQAVRALLTMDNVKLNDKGELEGLSEQLETLQKDKSFLFEPDVKAVVYSSDTPGGSPTAGSGLKGAIEDHYKNQ